MHVLVCIKQVPDTTEVKIDPETDTLVRAGWNRLRIPTILRAWKKPSASRKVWWKGDCYCRGPAAGDPRFAGALARGSGAVLLSDRAFAGADTLATSYTLSKAIEALAMSFPLTLCCAANRPLTAIRRNRARHRHAAGLTSSLMWCRRIG